MPLGRAELQRNFSDTGRDNLQPVRRTPFRRVLLPITLFTATLTISYLTPLARARPASDYSRRIGAYGMPEPHSGSLLVLYYEGYLKDQDIDSFRQNVLTRYTEGTLARLVQASDPQARRAAVLGLGLTGTFAANASVAKALRDPDPTLRRLAEMALWAIWFRADTPENNTTLEQVRDLITRQQLEEAIALASRLINRSPQFAEAYNQRAIAEFFLGRFRESADDCRKAIERNPYHIGALSGLANCQIRLEKRASALETLRRAAKIQPYSSDIRQWIMSIEADER